MLGSSLDPEPASCKIYVGLGVLLAALDQGVAGGTVLVALVVLSLSPAQAQKAPDAGTFLRSFGGGGAPPAPILPIPAPSPSPPSAAKGGPRLLVTGFRIHATLFPERELKALLASYVGRELTLSDLDGAARKIDAYYLKHDLLARAYIPRQEIKNGVVDIDVLESRLQRVMVDPASRSRLDPEIATAIATDRAPPGEVLHPSELQEGMAILNEVPGVQATSLLQPGSEAGGTAADIVLQDRPLATGSLVVDNGGVRWSGAHRAIASAALNDTLGRGEQVSALGLASSGSDYERVVLKMPVGGSGLAVGIDGSHFSYELEGPFASLHQTGDGNSGGVLASYPIRREADLALSALASLDYVNLVDRSLGTELDNRGLTRGTAGLAARTLDSWMNGATNDLGVSLTLGNLDRGADPADLAADQQTAKTEGAFGKIDFSGSRLQHLVGQCDLYVALRGQIAAKNLDSSEKFSLGGPQGVRAYPVNEANGDHGFLSNTELRYHLPFGVTLAGFYDLGGIVQNFRTWSGWQTRPGEPNAYLLQGAGVALSWTPFPQMLLSATYARALGTNPGVDANGDNAAGGSGKNQLWLEASIAF